MIVREAHGPARAAGIFFETAERLVDERTPYQRIEIFENANFGTVLLLDGLVMTTDADHHYYHESLVHPALTAHPRPRSVLVVGGGDGGTVTELVRYATVERIVMVEIDRRVVELCREHFPELSRGLDDPRVEVRYTDGAAFVATTDERFDVIVVDGSDPVGPAAALFSERFYAGLARCLAPGGIVVLQSESPFYDRELIETLHAGLGTHLAWIGLYTGPVPTYPAGWWSWTWGGLGALPIEPVRPAPAGCRHYRDALFPTRVPLPQGLAHLATRRLR